MERPNAGLDGLAWGRHLRTPMGAVGVMLSAFAAACVAPLVTKWAGRHAGRVLCLVPAALAAYFASLLPAASRGEVLEVAYPWIPSLGLGLAFTIDALSLLFALLITGVGTLVVLYAGRYLEGHSQLGRFFGVLFLFMASMLGLVLSSNVLLLFVFWELTSISSFLLIGFNHHKESARQAALQGLLVTVAGGQALLVGLILLGNTVGAFDVGAIVAGAEELRANSLYMPIVLLVAAGAFTKSAIVPFHFWLPSAMAAPTPVSAYLHAATMVKAGVYLLARLHPALGGTELWQMLLTVGGLATLVVSAWMALGSTDLKRVLAYSTVAVLGIAIALLGMGTPLAAQAAVTYVAAHAAYKGALFLVAGIVDHETGERDAEKLGGLRRMLPFTTAAAALATLSMMGLSPFFGFVGKELIVEAALTFGWWGVAVPVAVAVGFAALVAAAVLAGLKPFWGRAGEPVQKTVHEAPWDLWAGPAVLALLGLGLGLGTGLLTAFFGQAAAVIAGPDALQPPLLAWPHASMAFAVSTASALAGVGLFFVRRPLRAVGKVLALHRVGPTRLYALSIRALDWVAARQTYLFQHGKLRIYVLVTVVTFTGLVGAVLFGVAEHMPRPAMDDLRFHDVVALLCLLAGALVTVVTRSALTAIIALGVAGIGESLVYAFFSAPDLAIAQLVIQILTLVVFALIFARFHVHITEKTWIRSGAVVALGAGGVFGWLAVWVLGMPHYRGLAEGLAARSVPEAHGRNIVNVILVDFRALDTLGEVAVLAMAGLGVLILMRGRNGAVR
jgi:multicomponent Na+:H+ antiporter subunit A